MPSLTKFVNRSTGSFFPSFCFSLAMSSSFLGSSTASSNWKSEWFKVDWLNFCLFVQAVFMVECPERKDFHVAQIPIFVHSLGHFRFGLLSFEGAFPNIVNDFLPAKQISDLIDFGNFYEGVFHVLPVDKWENFLFLTWAFQKFHWIL